jgi:multidrug efflux pump subunit AcrB
MAVGVMVALVGMFALLTMEFRSHVQPLLVLAIIPFGGIGAVFGHWILGLPLTILSFFGMVGLTGIVVNDSIVLIDFVNHRLRDGAPIRTALLNAGRRRFRPVVITSITTICGLTPILLEQSLQAQELIPMASSLCFGLAFSTVLVLLLMPVLFLVYYRVVVGEDRIEPSPIADAQPTEAGELAARRIVRTDLPAVTRDP